MRSPIFRPNSGCTLHCRSIPAAWEFWLEIIAKRPAISDCAGRRGFVYPQGYFHQRITSEGRQEASYERFDFGAAPMEAVITRDTEGGLLALNLNSRVIYIEVWRLRLGSASIYLMATDVEENDPWDRELSARLYGGDQETRIRQEMVLESAACACSNVWDTPDGLPRQRRARLVPHARTHSLHGPEREELRRSRRFRPLDDRIYNTHAGSAGHDVFSFIWSKSISTVTGVVGAQPRAISWSRQLSGRIWGALFNMTALALRLAGRRNGVSQMHGRVSRAMWRSMWPEMAEDDVPILSVTNGVHTPTWVAPEMDKLSRNIWGTTGATTTTILHCGARPRHPRRGIVGHASTAQAQDAELHARTRPARLDQRSGGPDASPDRWDAAQSRRAHHRLCAPLRHL